MLFRKLSALDSSPTVVLEKADSAVVARLLGQEQPPPKRVPAWAFLSCREDEAEQLYRTPEHASHTRPRSVPAPTPEPSPPALPPPCPDPPATPVLHSFPFVSISHSERVSGTGPARGAAEAPEE